MPPPAAPVLTKEALLQQVKKMNAKAESARKGKEGALQDQLHSLVDDLAACQDNLTRLRHDKSSADFQAAKVRKAQLEAEIEQVKRELDPVYEFEQVNATLDRVKAAGAASDTKDTAAFARMAKQVDDRLHKKTGWAVHPKAFSLNTKDMKDLISRPVVHLGDSDPSLLTMEWTRFDHKPAVPWRKPLQYEGLAVIAAAERHAAREAEIAAEQAAAAEAARPPLDLSFGVPKGSADGTATGHGHGTGRSGSSRDAHTRAGHRGVAGQASPTRSRARSNTLRSTGRTITLPEVPSHTVNVTQLTAQPLQQELLGTLSLKQRQLPRHPAYLLDSTVHHKKRWLKGDKDPKAFSVPPRVRVPTKAEIKAAKRAIVPDRVFYHPRAEGKDEFYKTDEAPYPLFSRMPLDRDWERLEDARRAEALEVAFAARARAMEDDAGGYEGEDAFGGEAAGEEGGEGPAPTGAPLKGMGNITLQGEPSLPFALATAYAARKTDILAHMPPPPLGAKILDRARKVEAEKLEAIAARIAAARASSGLHPHSGTVPGATMTLAASFSRLL